MPHRLHESSLVNSTGEGTDAGALAHPTESRARITNTVNPDHFLVPGTFIDNLAKKFKKNQFSTHLQGLRFLHDLRFSLRPSAVQPEKWLPCVTLR
jgi:hypothetical protein